MESAEPFFLSYYDLTTIDDVDATGGVNHLTS